MHEAKNAFTSEFYERNSNSIPQLRPPARNSTTSKNTKHMLPSCPEASKAPCKRSPGTQWHPTGEEA